MSTLHRRISEDVEREIKERRRLDAVVFTATINNVTLLSGATEHGPFRTACVDGAFFLVKEEDSTGPGVIVPWSSVQIAVIK